jgi:hypothetical protein
LILRKRGDIFVLQRVQNIAMSRKKRTYWVKDYVWQLISSCVSRKETKELSLKDTQKDNYIKFRKTHI